MGHRNPRDQKKYEKDVGREIYTIAKMLRDCADALVIYPGVRIDPKFYYDEKDHPSRFAELQLDTKTSLRVGLERHRLSAGRWGLGWNIFSGGVTVEEGEISSPQVNFFRPTIATILEHYLLVSNSRPRD